VVTDVYVNFYFCLEEQSPPKEPPQAAPPWNRSHQWLLSAGRLIKADNTDMV